MGGYSKIRARSRIRRSKAAIFERPPASLRAPLASMPSSPAAMLRRSAMVRGSVGSANPASLKRHDHPSRLRLRLIADDNSSSALAAASARSARMRNPRRMVRDPFERVQVPAYAVRYGADAVARIGRNADGLHTAPETVDLANFGKNEVCWRLSSAVKISVRATGDSSGSSQR